MIKQETKKPSNSNFPLKQIYFYLTEGCNLACRHCWLNPKHQTETATYPMLPVELFNSIVEQALPLGLNQAKLTGGEPLMHPQIDEILKRIKHYDLKLRIETNAVLCTPEISESMASCKKPSVSVSLDGADAETHDWVRGIKGSFDLTLKGIKNLANAGLKPNLIMSIMRYNKDQMEAVVGLAESLGARSLKFNIVQPTGRGEKMSTGGDTLTIAELLELGDWVDNTLSKTTDLGLYFHLPPAFRPLGKIYGDGGTGTIACGLHRIIGVLANGSYALCGIGTHIPELVFGNAETVRLEDVWNKNEVLVSLREGIPHRFEGICGECLMKDVCIGSCIAQNYYTSKNLWAPYWLCDEAHKSGLFPPTRIRS